MATKGVGKPMKFTDCDSSRLNFANRNNAKNGTVNAINGSHLILASNLLGIP